MAGCDVEQKGLIPKELAAIYRNEIIAMEPMLFLIVVD
jgi:hypothetical protein